MKKILNTLAILFTIITFTSCEGDEGPMGPKGDPGVSWYTKTITISKYQWKLSGAINDLNSYYYAEIPISELSQFIFNDGTVLAYIEPENGIKNGLPYVLHKGEKVNGKEYLWTQTYDFDFEVGYMTFYLTYSDFNTISIPDTETFHIVLMW